MQDDEKTPDQLIDELNEMRQREVKSDPHEVMPIPLRVLIVEDSEDDTLLIVNQLESAGYDVTFRQTETPGAFVADLDSEPWDIIIADYVVPRLSAPVSLFVSRTRLPDVPFIVVSGMIGEELASEVLNAGADEFVSKHHIKGIVPAVQRALSKAEIKRLDPALAIKNLRVLIVEDSEDDVFLLVDKLEKGGFHVQSQRVESAASMRQALQEKSWDIIIADFAIPGFGGREALEVLKDSGQDLPFILISGKIGEEKAVEIIRAGAHDFIQKGNLTRLTSAVERELLGFQTRRRANIAEKIIQKMVDGMEEIIQTKTHQLGGRVKELSCLYAISKLVEKYDISLDQTLQGVVDVIPTSWQYPEITCANIILPDREFKTENYKVPVSKQSADIIVYGKNIGVLEVGYWEESPERDEGPFMKEERNLINAVAEQLGRIIEHKRAEQEKLELELKLLHAQRYESLNVMAGGIAHDFNNQLAIVLGNLEFALMDKNLDPKTQVSITNAVQSAKKQADLVRQIQIYTGNIFHFPEGLDINELLNKNLSQLKSCLSKHVILNLEIGSNLPVIKGNANQIERLINNIVVNASEAIGDKAGEVTIRTGVMDCDEAYLRRSHPIKHSEPGRFVFLEVSDTDGGMDAETQHKLFDPFFSTKFMGRGLGMAEVVGIAKVHLGTIIVDSEVGKGTTIRVLFPVSKEAQASSVTDKEVVETKSPESDTATPRKTILIVEDEEGIRDLAVGRLDVLGYNAIIAGDGQECVHVFRERLNEIDLVMLDFVMPKMDGVEAFGALIRIKPDVKVLLSSGYAEDVVMRRFPDQRPAGVLHKPYNLEDLKVELERLLGTAD